MYAPSTVKRQKVVRETRSVEPPDNFPGIGKIEYKPELPFTENDVLHYKYYNSTERIHGRSMEDWLKPSVYLGRCFTPYIGSVQRPWLENSSQSVDNYKKSIRAMFEMCLKLGIKHWSGLDRDVGPEANTFDESYANYEQIYELILDYQQKTGIRPLWIGVDLKYQGSYKNGAYTNSDPNIVALALIQVRKALDMALKLNAECFLLTGETESFDNVLNGDIKKEMKHYSRFVKLVLDMRDKIGYKGQLLMQTERNYERKCRDEIKYSGSLFEVLTFLKHYNYDHYFKVNVVPGSDFYMANFYGAMGTVDVKHADLHDLPKATLMLKTVIENGGFGSGGLTFHIPKRNGPFEPKDLMEQFVTSIDVYAKALKVAVKLVNDAQINKMIQARYVGFTTGWGAKFITSESAIDECEDHLKKLNEGSINITQTSTRYDHWSSLLVRYIDAPLK